MLNCELLHDIGNPPFGHSGEDAIREWFASKVGPHSKIPVKERPINHISIFGANDDPDFRFEEDILKYEGNAQTLRLLSRLQVFSDRRGLNLTAATFSVLCKYTADSLTTNKDIICKKKLGHYTSEKRIVELVQEETGTGKSRHPLTYLLEASDDICYILGDLEDAVKKGVVQWKEIQSQAIAPAEHGKEFIKKIDEFSSTAFSLHKGGSIDECAVQYFRVIAMAAFVQSAADTFEKRYEKILSGNYENDLISDPYFKHAALFESLRTFSIEKIYASKETIRLEVLGTNIIKDLLNLFSTADNSGHGGKMSKKLYKLISSNYRTVYETEEVWERGFPIEYRKTLLITDYICGMTDTFAVRLHKQLFSGNLG